MACFVAYSEILGDYAQVNLFENETLGIGLIFPAIPTKDFLNQTLSQHTPDPLVNPIQNF